jgi:hypothetical protein
MYCAAHEEKIVMLRGVTTGAVILIILGLCACAPADQEDAGLFDTPTPQQAPTVLPEAQMEIDPEGVVQTPENTSAGADTLEVIAFQNAVQRVFFPRQTPLDGGRGVMEAELRGELQLVGECLRVVAAEGDISYLIIWPPGYTMNDTLEAVRDENETELVGVGLQVYLSGGEIPVNVQTTYEAQHAALPLRACPGPY